MENKIKNKTYSLKNKNGQVTIFVIIGVILIIVVTFLLSNSKIDFFESKETKLISQVTDIVDSCIKENSNRGAFLLGIQGGYIELDDSQLSVPRSYIDLGFKIPSWEIAPNKVPTISSMQTELNEYIQNNAMICISGNLNTLTDLFDFEYENNLQVKTKINKNNIVVESNLPIAFSEKNSDELLNIESYLYKLDDNNLGDLYSLGIEIYSTEQQNDILSNLVLDQIYSASDYSSKYSMPTEGMSFSCAKKVWTKSQLKSNLVNLNNNNFKYLYFEGTQPITQLYDSTFNDEILPVSAASYYNNYYTFTLADTKSSFSNYKVEISMPTTQSTQNGNYFQKDRFRTFDVSPSNGEIIQSTDMKVDIGIGAIPIPCVQLFHSLYTLDYDLLVKITDYSNNNKNIFQFPLRVQINNNAPSSEIPFTLPSTNQDTQLTATDAKFCASENRVYSERIYAVDKTTQQPINGAKINYKCVALSCDLGETKKQTYRGFEVSQESLLSTNLPYCVGGTLTAEKEGFFTTKQVITTDGSNTNSNGYYDIEMIPTKSFQITGSTTFAKSGADSGRYIEDETDGMMFISIKNEEYDFQSQAIWPTSEGIMDELEFLVLDDIVYDVSVIITNENYDLVGIFELKDWSPEIHSGNTIKILAPVSTGTIDEENFMEFYETSNQLISGELNLGLKYGISFE